MYLSSKWLMSNSYRRKLLCSIATAWSCNLGMRSCQVSVSREPRLQILLLATSVPSKVFELGPILPDLTKIRWVLVPKSLASAENWLNCQEKASFALILTKPVEPIFSKCWANFGPHSLKGNTACYLPMSTGILFCIF